MLTASDKDEVASWDNTIHLGAFTHYFLEGVSGKADGFGGGDEDGRISLAELHTFLEKKVVTFVYNYHGRSQNPIIYVPKGLNLKQCYLDGRGKHTDEEDDHGRQGD